MNMTQAIEQGVDAAALAMAIQFHETYERLAPSFGYETRIETRTFDSTTPNGRLMVAVCAEITRQHCEEVARLQASLDELYGAKFSDRCYHALKSRAECAEAELAKLTAPAERVPYIELALYEDDKETEYLGYHRVQIPYDAWSWEIKDNGLLTNRIDIVFPQSSGNYYKAPITHVCAWIDGKRQMVRLSRALGLGPPAIIPVFNAGQLSLATETTSHG